MEYINSFRWSNNLLVSVCQTTRPRIIYFHVNEAISMNEHRAPILISSNWRWYLLQCIVHISHFFTDLGIGAPLNVGCPGCTQSATPLIRHWLSCTCVGWSGPKWVYKIDGFIEPSPGPWRKGYTEVFEHHLSWWSRLEAHVSF